MSLQVTNLPAIRQSTELVENGYVDLSSIYKTTKFISKGIMKKIKEDGYTIKEISLKTKKCPSTISKLVSGETKSPHYNTIMSVLKFLDVKIIGEINNN